MGFVCALTTFFPYSVLCIKESHDLLASDLLIALKSLKAALYPAVFSSFYCVLSLLFDVSTSFEFAVLLTFGDSHFKRIKYSAPAYYALHYANAKIIVYILQLLQLTLEYSGLLQDA